MGGGNRLNLRKLLKRVAIVGPESSGKSRLTKELAAYYKTNMVAEYAREFFRDRNYEYTLGDLITITKCQMNNEEDVASQSESIIFCDTEMIVMKIWANEVFGEIPNWIQQEATEKKYNLYLLCYPDLKWEPDPLRVNPHNRQYIYNLFVKELEQNGCNYKVIKGIGEQRLKNAINFVDELLKDGS